MRTVLGLIVDEDRLLIFRELNIPYFFTSQFIADAWEIVPHADHGKLVKSKFLNEHAEQQSVWFANAGPSDGFTEDQKSTLATCHAMLATEEFNKVATA
jgi:hypothetical protein